MHAGKLTNFLSVLLCELSHSSLITSVMWVGHGLNWSMCPALRTCTEFSRKLFLNLSCYEISLRWDRGQGQRIRVPGLKVSVVLPVHIYLIKYRESLPLSHPDSTYPEPWPCLEWAPDGSGWMLRDKRFLVCSRVYQCLNRAGGSAGTPYQQLIKAHGFPGTLLVPRVYPAPSALS